MYMSESGRASAVAIDGVLSKAHYGAENSCEYPQSNGAGILAETMHVLIQCAGIRKSASGGLKRMHVLIQCAGIRKSASGGLKRMHVHVPLRVRSVSKSVLPIS